jgi:hypothetical protein
MRSGARRSSVPVRPVRIFLSTRRGKNSRSMMTRQYRSVTTCVTRCISFSKLLKLMIKPLFWHSSTSFSMSSKKRSRNFKKKRGVRIVVFRLRLERKRKRVVQVPLVLGCQPNRTYRGRWKI